MSSTDRVLRFGCIGCGGIGRIHVRNSRFVPGMQVTAFADLDKAKAQSMCDEFGGQYATDDPNKIFNDPEIDAVLIQTGASEHGPLGIAAAKAGKHIFMEKPISDSYPIAVQLVRAVRENRVKYLIGLCNRLSPLVLRAKRLCPHPVISYCQCTDTISGQASHNLDLAVHLFHESVLRTVYAAGGNYWNSERTYPVDGCATILRFADGSVHNYLQHGKARNPMLTKYHYQLFGRDNVCVFLADRFKSMHYCLNSKLEHSFVFEGADTSEPQVDPRADVRGPYGYMGHFEELEQLCRCIREGAEPTLTVEQGAYVLAVELAIIKSAETGRVIVMSDFLEELNRHRESGR